MNYSIESGKHSADKDHRIMTGGTLSVDKTVRCVDGVKFYTYSLPFYVWWDFDINFHKWVHAAEHMIAYKKDTGSVRNSLEEVTRWKLSWKVILDISPCRTSSSTFGFRITSMVPLEVDQVRELSHISITRAIDFLKRGEIEDQNDFQWIPFARSVSCGQYDFHDKQRAINDLRKIDLSTIRIEENIIASIHEVAYVCDLRFLKPKTDGADDMVMFSPDFSYRISELIEKELPKRFPWSICIVGTFWCMTGMYLCISSEMWDESDIPTIHKLIIDIIKDNIWEDDLDHHEKLELKTLLENYEKYRV